MDSKQVQQGVQQRTPSEEVTPCNGWLELTTLHARRPAPISLKNVDPIVGRRKIKELGIECYRWLTAKSTVSPGAYIRVPQTSSRSKHAVTQKHASRPNLSFRICAQYTLYILFVYICIYIYIFIVLGNLGLAELLLFIRFSCSLLFVSNDLWHAHFNSYLFSFSFSARFRC